MLSWGMTLHREFGESRLFQCHIKPLLHQTELCLLDLLLSVRAGHLSSETHKNIKEYNVCTHPQLET